MTNTTTTLTHPSPLLTLLHPSCQQGYHGNLTVPHTYPPQTGASSRGSGQGAGDTDFGAVMYISAVLIFYSLGIVVMIVKYLRTERREIEDELMVENFVKGIPSKRMEHEQEAVHRVAIRAFHTLTSRAPWQEETTEPSRMGDMAAALHTEREGGGSAEDSEDCGTGESSSCRLGQQRSKHLPRVSLMLRHSRCSHHHRRQLGRQKKVPSLPQDRPLCVALPTAPPLWTLTETDPVDRGPGDASNVCGQVNDSNGSPADEALADEGITRQACGQGHCRNVGEESRERGWQDERKGGAENASHGGRETGTGPPGSAEVKRDTPLTPASSHAVTDGQVGISNRTISEGDTTAKGTTSEEDFLGKAGAGKSASSAGGVDCVGGSEGNVTASPIGTVSHHARDCDVSYSLPSTDVNVTCLFGPRRVLVSDV